MHKISRAIKHYGKNCEEAQIYGTDMKEEASLWQDVGEQSVLRKDDEFV